MPTILQLDNVTKRFIGLVAVNNFSLKVEENTVHSLIGPNGSGKTTTLNMICGTRKATEGKILFQGEDITQLPTFKIAKKGIGRTFQNIKLFNSMTVLENVMVGGSSETKLGLLRSVFDIPNSLREERQLKEKAEEVLNLLGLYKLRKEVVKNLPYGRQKVLELGRTLMTNPKLILLDERQPVLIRLKDRNSFLYLASCKNKGKRFF